MMRRSYFFLFLGAIGMLSGIGQWLMFRHSLMFLDTYAGILPFLLLPLTFVLPNIASEQLSLPLTKILARIGGYWFIFTYYSLLLLIPFFLLWLISLAGILPYSWNTLSMFYGTGALTLLFLALLLGSWRAFHSIYRHITITTNQKLMEDKTIAFASDIHLGAVIGSYFSKKLVRQMNAVHPDLILLGGDLIDGNLSLVLQDHSLQPLQELRAPLGVFAVWGNHDYYGQNLDTEREALAACGIRILKNEQVILENSILLFGMDDYSYHFSEKIPSLPEPYFQIILEHETWRIRQAAHAGCDLFLCGHTHAGQFWPNRYVTKRMYSLDYGTRKIGKLLAVVSSGYGHWGVPVRIGPPPEIVVIHLKTTHNRAI